MQPSLHVFEKRLDFLPYSLTSESYKVTVHVLGQLYTNVRSLIKGNTASCSSLYFLAYILSILETLDPYDNFAPQMYIGVYTDICELAGSLAQQQGIPSKDDT